MIPTSFPSLLNASLAAAAQQQLFLAQGRDRVIRNLAVLLPGAAQLPQMPMIPLPTSAAPAAARPSPMLVPPGMAAEDNAVSSPHVGGSEGEWTEHKTSDGRVYYHNRVTKQSRWATSVAKPEDGAARPVWREFKTDDGRSYYYNTNTKKTTWEKPEGEEISKYEPQPSSSSSSAENKQEVKVAAKKEESDLDKAMKATLASIPGVPLPNEKKGEEPINDEAELKKRQSERFRELLRDKYNDGKITTSCNWDQAVKFIQNDPRFRILNKVSEKKQLFNAWKVQRQKEERDEKRFAIKKAKEDLEKFLQGHSKVKEHMKYSKACEIFAKEPLWMAVGDDDRVDIFRDCLEFVAKRDAEKREEVRKRNTEALSQILQSMDQITYKTTWAQAQRLLIENPQFADDTTLQSMDKEDALIVFEDHIKAAEREHEIEKEQEERRHKRQERKVREDFQALLNELHKKGELTSMSLWSSLYPIISTDTRFDFMLMQSGSTPLDLFKFFVEDLKEQYIEDRRKIKEILAEKGVQVMIDTEYELFSEWVLSHENGNKVDHGNMKLCFNSLIEKAESKAKDEEREIVRKKRRVESEFRNLLKTHNVDAETEWLTVKPKIEKEKAYLALEGDENCEKCFNDYKTLINESCHHVHSTGNAEKSKKKKKDKKKKNKRSDRDSESEGEIREKKKKKKHSKEKDRSDDEEERAAKKSKKSRKRSRSRSASPYEPEKRKHYSSESD